MNLQENIRKVLREESQKQSRLLSKIEKDGLYQVMQDTGLSMQQIVSRYDNLPRKVFERFIKDFVENEGEKIGEDVGLVLDIEISPNKIVEAFYLIKGVVKIQVNELDSRNRMVAGSIERLSVLSDEEILTIVDHMINWVGDIYYEI